MSISADERTTRALCLESGREAAVGNGETNRVSETNSHQIDADFRSLFEEAPIPYHEIDRNGLLVRINRAECEVLHVRADDVIGRPVWEMVSPDQRELSRAAVTRTLRESRTLPPFERKYCGGDGIDRVFEVHERMIFGPGGEITGIRTVLIDLTESKRADRQIAFQAGLLNQINDAVAAVDEGFRVKYWNRAAELLFGRSAAEVMGSDYGDAIQDTLSVQERTIFRRRFVEKGESRVELVCRRPSGEEVIVELSATVLHDDAGRLCGAVGIHRDLTDQRRAEAALVASESRFKLVESALGIGCWEIDARSGRLTSSLENRSIFGITGSDLRFDNPEAWLEGIHPQDRARAARQFQTACLDGGSNANFGWCGRTAACTGSSAGRTSLLTMSKGLFGSSVSALTSPLRKKPKTSSEFFPGLWSRVR